MTGSRPGRLPERGGTEELWFSEWEHGIGALTTLQRKGIPSQFPYFPDENHWVPSPANGIRWHETVLAWLACWTGNQGSQEDVDRGR